jgi:hypothetical protein
MNFTLDKLLNILPEGEKKQALMLKLQQVKRKAETKKGGDGLADEFSLKPTGHIMIEQIDNKGNVMGVLADQPNLVVNGAEEILLRAFSGDPDRVLYKNRVLKGSESSVYHVPVTSILEAQNGQNVLVNHPNEYWKAVDESEFDSEFSYYPNTLQVVEVPATEPNMKAFKVKAVADPTSAPLTAEIYSTFTNLFIGIGDGKNKSIPLTDTRITFDAGFSGDAARKVTSTLNDEVEFAEKITNFVVEYEKSNEGGQFEVYVDGVLKNTVETFDSGLAAGITEVSSIEIKGLNHEVASAVRIKFSGSDPASVTPKVAIVGIRFDSFTKADNGLLHELENHTKKFETPAVYNTTTEAPYTVSLPHFPVVADKVVVDYEGSVLTQVATKAAVVEGTYFVDEKYGKLHFKRALTNLFISFETTGEILEDEIVSNLTTKPVEVSVQDEVPTGAVDGTNRLFQLSRGITSNSEVVKVNGVAKIRNTDFNVNSATGLITFITGKQPLTGEVVTVDFKYNVNVIVFNTQRAITDGSLSVLGNGADLTLTADVSLLEEGTFMVDPADVAKKTILVSEKAVGGAVLAGKLEVVYASGQQPGVPTNYTRQVIMKPKDVNQYPWYALDKGSIQFVAEFAEETLGYNITIREMGLFDGPRSDDQVKGFRGYPVKAFSLVRVGETRKEVNTGIRITWTITLLNESGQPFKGGY